MFPVLSANTPSTGYNLTNSLRFRASASAYLSRTPSSASNRKTWTWSAWVKRGALGGNQSLFSARPLSGGGFTFLRFVSDTNPDTITFADNNGAFLATSALHRDVAAWYHIVLSVDTTQATASNRVRMFVNGNQVTAFSTATYPSQNLDMSVNNNINHWLANNADGAGSLINFFDGYMDEINFIDGQALTSSSFGSFNSTTGVWQPARYTGTYGTNGFYLNFTDIALTSGSNTGLGRDFSGNGNFWNTNNISVTAGVTYDAMSDVPTLTSATIANYAVVSPIDVSSVGATISNGNLRFNNGSAGSQSTARATIGVSSGKWYWETTCTTFGGSNPDTGILGSNSSLSSADQYVGNYALGYSYGGNGQKRNNNSGSAYGASYTSGDIIGVALDMDAGTLTFYKNNVSQGTAYTGLSGLFSPAISGYNGVIWDVNYGQRPFAYTPPTGFNRLNTFNLPTSTIVKGNSYMDATTYSGNSSTQNIVNAGGFRPDYLWIKCRSAINNNTNFDSTRGVLRQLYSNLTNAETVAADGLAAFNSNGFSLDNTGSGGNVNVSGRTYVAWQWNANNGTTSTNNSGSITSTVQANTTAGFSIVTYTGTGSNATVGHGLGVAPRMIIVKNRTTSGGNGIWRVYHASLGATQVLNLNELSAAASLSTVWNNTTPTSSVFSVGITGSVNDPSNNYVAYCWAEIAGFSRFGSYTGNGSTDGPFVYLGFRPEFLMIKVTSTTEQWAMKDATRVPYNTNNTQLFANAADPEDTNNTFHMIDFLSNGFKMRGAAQNLVNGSGQNYIYMAFAENPFKNALAR